MLKMIVLCVCVCVHQNNFPSLGKVEGQMSKLTLKCRMLLLVRIYKFAGLGHLFRMKSL